MSDPIKHECGTALVRLRKPLSWYQQSEGGILDGFNRLLLLMEKQHNRGHDGAGVGCCKLDMPLGQPYLFRERESGRDSLANLFEEVWSSYRKKTRKKELDPESAEDIKSKFEFAGEVLMGHLRYGTSGAFGKGACHPYLRRSNWPTKSLMVLGNFNMTNTGSLNRRLIELGQHPVFDTDTQTVLEEIGFHLDEQHQSLYYEARDAGIPGHEIPKFISEKLDVVDIVRRSAAIWDGGYTICGTVGNGDCFVLRDPTGIRPCYYFYNEEYFGFASERVPLMSVFDLPKEEIKELPPGHVFVIKKNGDFQLAPFTDVVPEKKHCSFERIYFSRGNDPGIYKERKALGAALAPQILHEIKHNFANTVFSFIPNTAETAYYGMMDGLRLQRRKEVREELLSALEEGTIDREMIDRLILGNWPRSEKIAHKDIKLRTFISQEQNRNVMASHVYDITYEVVKPEDNLVVIDDSIVRGTTLKRSILRILSKTNPMKIIVVSTAPQIRYPDCYGIDMSEMGKFIAFQAAIELLKQGGKRDLLTKVYQNCLEELKKPTAEQKNQVKQIYDSFTPEEISLKISELVRPQNIPWKGEVVVLFQTIENLHTALGEGYGDWYFTGDYPTPGGYAIVNRAFVDYFEDRKGRSYELL